ncbi:cytochrome c biogenesis protein CcdA, partial [Patescibacteria group bacterium]|nr:cytochrome c biogenesis protein CcdA [Patescibacteria group bacterium]
MLVLIVFAFIGGVVTILSPCILPVLPIILSGTVGEGKRRPYGIILGFVISFSFFTLFLTAIVKLFGVSPDILRTMAVVVLVLFGLSLIVPKFQKWVELLFSKLANRGSQTNRTGFSGGIIVGASLGLLWTPCVGPILAGIISLALSEAVTGAAVIIIIAYALGTAIPMFIIMQGGRKLLKKVPWLM